MKFPLRPSHQLSLLATLLSIALLAAPLSAQRENGLRGLNNALLQLYNQTLGSSPATADQFSHLTTGGRKPKQPRTGRNRR